MKNQHICHMYGGSIVSANGSIIENPAIMVSKSNDTIHGWGELEKVQAKFEKYVDKFTKAGMTDEAEDLMLIELSQYKISREIACYVICRAVEFTATGFIKNLCRILTENQDPIAWIKSEMERIPIDINDGNDIWSEYN